jgi:hypothetical protein
VDSVDVDVGSDKEFVAAGVSDGFETVAGIAVTVGVLVLVSPDSLASVIIAIEV